MRRTFAAIAVSALASLFLATPARAAPSVANILSANKAASGGSAWDDKVTLSADYIYFGQGLTGTTHSLTDLKNGRTESNYSIGPATGANGFDGTNAWEKDTSGTITLQQGGDALVLAVNNAYRSSGKWWRADRGGASIVDDGEKTIAGATYDVLTVTPKGGKPFDIWIGSNSHLLSKIIEKQGSQTVTTTLSGYGAVDGVMLPYRIAIDAGAGEKYLQTLSLTKAKTLAASG